MTDFAKTWSTTYETEFTDANYGYEIDDEINELKVAVRERMEVDHEWGNTTQDGKHKAITLVEQSTLGTPAANEGIIAGCEANSKCELYYKDEDENTCQITKTGGLNTVPSIETTRTSSIKTLTAAYSELRTFDLGSVKDGDIILLNVHAILDKGATAGICTIKIDKSSGTGGFLVFYNTAEIYQSAYLSANERDYSMTIFAILRINATGTLVLAINGISTGSDATIAANELAASASFIRKQ